MEEQQTAPKLEVSSLVADHSDALYRHAYYKTRNKEVAEDLVQETFMAVVRQSSTYRGESSPKTWLFSILRNKIADYYRKKMKQNITDKELDENIASFDNSGKWNTNQNPMILDDSQNLLDNPEFVSIFYKCIENLPQMWSAVIKMKYVNPTKSKEICKELNITDTNLWQIVHRSKLKLKDCLAQNWN